MSFVTGIIGGIQARSAAKNAAKEQEQAAKAAADQYGQAVADANPLLDTAYRDYAPIVTDAARAAGEGVTSAADGAATGVLDASGRAIAGMNNAVTQGNAYLDTYINGGKEAYTKLSDLVNGGLNFKASDLEMDPGYQFRIAEQQKAIERSAAARGGVMGGGTLKALTRYQGDAASQEYQNAFARAMAQQQAKAATLSQLVSGGLTASGQASQNVIGGAQYTGTADMQSQQAAGGFRTNAATYTGNANMNAANNVGTARLTLGQLQAGNLVNAGQVRADAALATGAARAQGHIGAANAWNGILSSIGGAVDGAITGGMSGGGGLSLGGMMRGMAGVPAKRKGMPGGQY